MVNRPPTVIAREIIDGAMSPTLPRYHLVIRWPDREHLDPDGTGFPDAASARRYAERVIRELKESGDDYDDPELLMVVTDGDGNEIFSLPFKTD